MPLRPDPFKSNPTQSPCVRNCCLNGDDVCVGCGRTLEDIRHWTAFTPEQRTHALKAAKKRVEAFGSGPF